MAGSSFFALIDDIATLLDDVLLYSKLAAKKTAGVLGDDLALNAEQVTGIRADRELPVVWAVAKGALVNKLVLVPLALLISTFLPWLVILLLMLGGAYLCYEGIEKVLHTVMPHAESDEQRHQGQLAALKDSSVSMVQFEKEKIKGAIRTDFILSAEIIVLTLGTVKDASFFIQLGVLSAVSVGVVIFVYGLVAGIVKLDDAGLYLSMSKGSSWFTKTKHKMGWLILVSAPYLMKLLSIVGTAAMFLVGGGIIAHNIPLLHHALEMLSVSSMELPSFGVLVSATLSVLYNLVTGVIVGVLSFVLVSVFVKLKTIKS